MQSLTTKRLQLRPLQVSDAESLSLFSAGATAELENARTTLGRWLNALARLDQRTGGGWTLNFPGQIDPIGVCFYGDADLVLEEVTLSYWLSENFREIGLGGEAIGEVVRHLFEDLTLRRLIADVELSNTASHRLLARLGFAPLTPGETPGVILANGHPAQRLALSSGRWRTTVLHSTGGQGWAT